MSLNFLTQFIDASKVGGWVRSGVAAGLGIALAKWPGLSNYLDPVTQAAIGAAAAGIVVGIWSQLTKSDEAKIKAVTALTDVHQVVVKPTATDGVAAAAADPTQPKVVTQ